MKKNITIIITAVLMTLSFSSFATTLNPLKSKDAKSILLTYAESTALGNTDFNKFLFSEDFEYQNALNNNSPNQGKVNRREYLQFLNTTKGLIYDCQTQHQILDITDKTAIAKAIFKFNNFTRVDHITLKQTSDGWKISKVITSYL